MCFSSHMQFCGDERRNDRFNLRNSIIEELFGDANFIGIFEETIQNYYSGDYWISNYLWCQFMKRYEWGMWQDIICFSFIIQFCGDERRNDRFNLRNSIIEEIFGDANFIGI